MLDKLGFVKEIGTAVNRVMDVIDIDQATEAYHSPEGFRCKIEAQGAEIFLMIREAADND
jgi:hypothetical protein